MSQLESRTGQPTGEVSEPITRPDIVKAARPDGFTRRTREECIGLLSSLIGRVLARRRDPYLELRARPNSLKRQVDAFMRYQDYLPMQGSVLDWGCKHAPDSCLIRYTLGDGLRMYGYDFDRGVAFREFYDYAGLEFTEAQHPFKLPYDDASMDVVLSSGVLEHVALTSASLSEIYRVLKPGGLFVVTFLPNHWSYTEFLTRHSGRKNYHRRRYTKRMLRQLLLHHGMEPQVTGYHQFLPAQRGGRLMQMLWPLNGVLERVWPFNVFSTNLYAVAIRRVAL